MVISNERRKPTMFKAPEMEIIRFAVEDVITTSAGGAGGDVGSENPPEWS